MGSKRPTKFCFEQADSEVKKSDGSGPVGFQDPRRKSSTQEKRHFRRHFARRFFSPVSKCVKSTLGINDNSDSKCFGQGQVISSLERETWGQLNLTKVLTRRVFGQNLVITNSSVSIGSHRQSLTFRGVLGCQLLNNSVCACVAA